MQWGGPRRSKTSQPMFRVETSGVGIGSDRHSTRRPRSVAGRNTKRRPDLSVTVSEIAADGTEQPHQGVYELGLVGSPPTRSSYEAPRPFASIPVPFAPIRRNRPTKELIGENERQTMQTHRDAQIVDWIARLGAAGAEHVMRRFDLSRSVAYGRLNSMARDGLLARHAVLYARPGMYTATTTGLRRARREIGRAHV